MVDIVRTKTTFGTPWLDRVDAGVVLLLVEQNLNVIWCVQGEGVQSESVQSECAVQSESVQSEYSESVQFVCAE